MRSSLDFDFDVAKAIPVVPLADVVVWPDVGVDEVEEECRDRPGDQHCGPDVAVPEVPEHWRDD